MPAVVWQARTRHGVVGGVERGKGLEKDRYRGRDQSRGRREERRRMGRKEGRAFFVVGRLGVGKGGGGMGLFSAMRGKTRRV